jgi:hypothetical protein
MERRENLSEEELNRRWTEPNYVDVMERLADFDPFPRA